jgi:hypothetical protein
MDSAARLQSSGVPREAARGISLIVPTYNEAESLPELFARIGAAFVGQEDLDPELLIADDASPDGTAALALKLASSARTDGKRARRIQASLAPPVGASRAARRRAPQLVSGPAPRREQARLPSER